MASFANSFTVVNLTIHILLVSSMIQSSKEIPIGELKFPAVSDTTRFLYLQTIYFRVLNCQSRGPAICLFLTSIHKASYNLRIYILGYGKTFLYELHFNSQPHIQFVTAHITVFSHMSVLGSLASIYICLSHTSILI